jgi:hypothetical protein
MRLFVATLVIALGAGPGLAGAAGVQVVVAGTVGAGGNVVNGSGFNVHLTPAGSGGTLLPGLVDVTAGSATVNASAGNDPQFTTELVSSQFIEIDNAFYQVASISSDTSLQLTSQFHGATASGVGVTRDMSLFPDYRVTFKTPFLGPPAIVVSARGGTPHGGESPAFNVMQIDQGTPVTKSRFDAFLFQSPFGPYLPGPSTDWDFVAVGKQ